MKRLIAILCFLAVPLMIVRAADRDPHIQEKGSGIIISQSCFAHGYRHGYEEGFHYGNLDVNMARPQRTRWRQFRELRSHYSNEFGSRTSFDAGFKAGAIAGYVDGYRGNGFRAIEELSRLGAEKSAPSVDFDSGIAAGYQAGLAQTPTKEEAKAPCSTPEDRKHAEPFCDGYQRGLVLGKSDRVALSGSAAVLEASR
ncbi:MAG TPA: hypothetical protein VE783_03210 [Candidatus Limnocylindrales bacterium]|jgi:hypothetical protein|nr:hypothetical protein [Candidatus Limnocylindrales bacterium]